MRKLLTVMAGIGLGLLTDAAVAGDAAAGKKVFARCRACHMVAAQENQVGPHLVNIVGRPAAAADGFDYSPALRESGLVWDEATLAAYLADPKAYVEGNRMIFKGLKNPEDIANVITYLRNPTAADSSS